MTPDPAITDPLQIAEFPAESRPLMPTTAGMTTKVVKGSLWTLVGQIAPVAAAFFCTPFVIRLLGTERYGVYVLIVLIPGYFAFADFGMNMASTKFASEAYGDGDIELEARLIRTSAAIAVCSILPIAVTLGILADPLLRMVNIPSDSMSSAVTALRICSAMMVCNLLSNIVNTPQLARLRMDLNTLISAVPKILGAIGVPLAVYLGFGIVGAVTVLFASSLLTLVGHLLVSWRLLPRLLGISLEGAAVRPLLKFGGALVLAGLAGVLLGNLEKLVLVQETDTATLAHYSVAFTLANMVTLFSAAMAQSLIPAFSQLTREDRRPQLRALYARGMRASLFGIPPLLVFLAVVAKPFFTLWGGEDFGRASPLPFYILLAGLFFNLNAYVPWSVLLSFGRTDLWAKSYWLQLVPYIGLVILLTSRYGAPGAAAAWSIRTFVDALVFLILVRRLDIPTGLAKHIPALSAGILVLSLPIIAMLCWGQALYWLIPLASLSLIGYSALIWQWVVADDEKAWLRYRVRHATGAI